MAHTYDEWVVWTKSGVAVHYTKQLDALKRFGDDPESVKMEHVVGHSICGKPQRGYCGLCYPFAEHAGQPDYTEGHSHVPAEVLNGD